MQTEDVGHAAEMVAAAETTMMNECIKKLTEGERTALIEEFRLFDKDKSGFITKAELSEVCVGKHKRETAALRMQSVSSEVRVNYHPASVTRLPPLRSGTSSAKS